MWGLGYRVRGLLCLRREALQAGFRVQGQGVGLGKAGSGYRLRLRCLSGSSRARRDRLGWGSGMCWGD